jgi:hypothetical protein
MAERFGCLMQLFERSDPFYMAGSKLRRHLSHNVQVFLIGLVALTGLHHLRRIAIKQVQEIRTNESDTSALVDAILIWACIANTHDTAYLIEHLNELTVKLEELIREFAIVISAGEMVKEPSKAILPSQSHAEVAAKLWRCNLPCDELEL